MHRTGMFVDDILMSKARESGKLTWCEKTPHNLLFADFLLALIPDSVFVHMHRDPRGVAQSFAKQPWSSSDLRVSARTVRDIYTRWRSIRSRLDERRLIEFSLERFVTEPLPSLNSTLSKCGLAPMPSLPFDVSPERVSSWKTTISKQELNTLNEELGELTEAMGYAL